MCRICGRMLRCIFDSMPSRAHGAGNKRSLSTIAHQARNPGHPGSSRDLVRSTMNTRAVCSRLPPTFLLPRQAALHQAHSRRSAATPTQFETPKPEIPLATMQPSESLEIVAGEGAEFSDLPSTKPTIVTGPLVLSKSVQELLPALQIQKPHYITAHIHRFPYLLTEGDTLRLPFHMHGVSPGDILRLNRASILGSRNYTLKAGTARTETYDGKPVLQNAYLDERLFECRARVMGLESGPMMMKTKTKRRNRKVKTVKSKHKYTVLKIVEVRVKSLEELQSMDGGLLLQSGWKWDGASIEDDRAENAP